MFDYNKIRRKSVPNFRDRDLASLQNIVELVNNFSEWKEEGSEISRSFRLLSISPREIHIEFSGVRLVHPPDLYV